MDLGVQGPVSEHPLDRLSWREVGHSDRDVGDRFRDGHRMVDDDPNDHGENERNQLPLPIFDEKPFQ